MRSIGLPHSQDWTHPPARGQVMLLTCMDLRLLDEIGEFMESDNLSNRYDHVVFAGAALGVVKGESASTGNSRVKSKWKDVFFDHLEAAYKLHSIEDVYVLEHRNCGAYDKVFKVCKTFGDSPKDLKAEEHCHRKYVKQLRKEIVRWSKKKGIPMRVTSFIMDLRGNVKLLETPKKR